MSEKKKTVKAEEPEKVAAVKDGPQDGSWFSVGPDGRRRNFSKEREFPGIKKP